MYWYELTRKEKIKLILWVVVGTILFCWIPGALLGVFAAIVIIGCIAKIF